MSPLKLAATPLHAHFTPTWSAEPFVARLTTDPHDPVRANGALLWGSADSPPAGFAAYFQTVAGSLPGQFVGSGRILPLPRELGYLQDGDIVRVNPRRGEIWVMYRCSSQSNSLLLTERCNSWCVMCSQPPKARDDDALVRAWVDAIPLMDPATEELGFTGGEPTLLGDLFFDLVTLCREHLPGTALHVLSNGRLCNYLSFAQRLREAMPENFMIGIPLYSDLAWQHDFIVQAASAFDQTLRGILNLARCNVPVEIRVVLHRQSVGRLRQLAEFVCRNLPFVQHVALMGLEPIGFARANQAALWIDPMDYREPLTAAVRTLTNHGLNVSIYNHQLCVLPDELWPVARQSISDWKNTYLPVCGDCAVRKQCGGFFHSADVLHSRGIHPLPASGAPVGAEASV